jgi:hypothetical protein
MTFSIASISFIYILIHMFLKQLQTDSMHTPQILVRHVKRIRQRNSKILITQTQRTTLPGLHYSQ